MCQMHKISSFQIFQRLVVKKQSKSRLKLQSQLPRKSLRSKYLPLLLPLLQLLQAWSNRRPSLRRNQRRRLRKRRPSQLSQRSTTRISPQSLLP